MTFLTPIPAIVAGAIALPAILVLYFLKLRRRPVRVGSTMLWAQAAEDLQANVPFRWLRPSLLLLLQLLILAALLLALARPAVNTPGDMPEQVFVLVDRSASMAATDAAGGASRFESAVERARAVIERATVGSFRGEITLIGYASSAEIVAGPTRSRTELLRSLDALTPTDEPGDLAEALRLIQALARGDDEEEASAPLVLICSDGASRGELPALEGRAVLERPRLADAPGQNVGFVALAARRDSAQPTRLRIFARVLSALPEPATVGLTVLLEGEAVQRIPLSLESRAEDGPGQTPVSVTIDAPGGALVSLRLEREDALAADNTASFTIGAPRRPAVLLVREIQDEEAGSGWLLTDVLRELDLQSLTLISAARLAELGSEAFDGIDLVIYDGVDAPRLPPLPSLHLGRPPPVEGVSQREVAAGVLPLISWDRSSPLLRDVALDTVRIGRGVVFDAPAGHQAFRELGRTARGVVFGVAESRAGRHVLLGFELVQSTWPLHYSFPIFLANIIDALPAHREATEGRFFTTGRAASLPAESLPGPAVLADPAGREVRTLTRPEDPLAPIPLGSLAHAGVWSAGGLPLPVNLLDEHESSLDSPAQLGIPGAGAIGSGAGAGAEPREIWPWMLIAALALLALEWLLFALRVRV